MRGSRSEGAVGPTAEASALLRETVWLRRLAARLVGEGALADDLVQETCLRALDARPEARRTLRPWLATVLRNLVRRDRRDRERRRADSLACAERAPSAERGPDEALAHIESQALLLDVLRELRPELRDALVLRYLEGLDSREIARRRGLPEGTVRWRIQRALGVLRAGLDARHGGDGSAWLRALAPLCPGPWGPLAPPAPAPATSITLSTGVLVMHTAVKLAGVVALVGLAGWFLRDALRGEALPAPAVAARDAEPELPEPATPPEPLAPERVERGGPAPVAPAAVAVRDPAVVTVEGVPEREVVYAWVDARFLDEEGAPLANVALTLRRPEDGERVESRPDGRARLRVVANRGVPRGLELLATAQGRASAVLETTVVEGETSYLGDVELGPGSSVAGVVLGPDGRPARDARVFAAAIAESPDPFGRRARFGLDAGDVAWMTAQVRTRVDGRFLIEGLTPGPARVWAQAEGMRHSASEPLELLASELLEDVVVELAPWRSDDHVLLSVVDPTGAAVPHADLRIFYAAQAEGYGQSGSLASSTREDGTLRLTVNADVPHQIVASHPLDLYAPSAMVEVSGGDEVVLVLREHDLLRVEVVAADGTRLSEVEVFARPVQPSAEYRQHGVVHGRPVDGEPQVRVLQRPGEPFELVASAAGFTPTVDGPHEPDGERDTFRVELQRAPTIAGRVLRAGRGASGAVVVLHEAEDGVHNEVDGFHTFARQVYDNEGRSGEGGSFELLLPEAGRYYLRAHRGELGSELLGPFDSADGPPDPIVLELVDGGALEGRVLLDEGDGEGVVVGVSRGDGRARTQRAGPGGVFRFEGLPPGRYRVQRCASELVPGSSSSTRGGPVQEYVWHCVVESGGTTRWDLDLRGD